MKSPKTQPIINDNGIVTPIWSTYFDQQDGLVIKTASTRAQAGEQFVVLDGTGAVVTYTMPADQRPTARVPEAGQEFFIMCKDSTNACSIDLNGSTFYSDAGPISLVAEDVYYLKFDGTKWLGYKGTSSGGVTEFTELTDTPSSYVGEALKVPRVNAGETALEFVANSVLGLDHTTDLANVGTNTHAQVDTHIADATIHFTEGSIDHTAITNIGTNTHAQIDTHIADTSNPHTVTEVQVLPTQTANSGKYLTTNGTNSSWAAVANNSLIGVEFDERVNTYTSGLLTQVLYKLASSTVETLTLTYDSNNRIATTSTAIGGETVTYTHAGTGFLTGTVKV